MDNIENRDGIQSYEPMWGEWRSSRLIGQGATGNVYQAVRENAGQKQLAAVKMLTITGNDQNEAAASAIRAINLLYQLRGSSGIIGYDEHLVKQRQDVSCWDILVRMEYAISLPQYIAHNSLTQEDIVRIGIDCCNALISCEKLGIVHGGIQDNQIFAANNGSFKLGGFPLVRAASEKAVKNPLALLDTTPDAFYGNTANRISDLYALGLVLYKLMNHTRLPFMPAYPQEVQATDSQRALDKRMRGEDLPPPVMATPAFAEVILRACRYQPSERFASAADMKRSLEVVLTRMKQADASLVIAGISPQHRQAAAPAAISPSSPEQMAPFPSTVPVQDVVIRQKPARKKPVRKKFDHKKPVLKKFALAIVVLCTVLLVGFFGLQLWSTIADKIANGETVSARGNDKETSASGEEDKGSTPGQKPATGESTTKPTEPASETATGSTSAPATGTTSETTVVTTSTAAAETTSSPTDASSETTAQSTSKPTPKPTAKPTPKPTAAPTPALINNAALWNPNGSMYYEGSSVTHKNTLYLCILAHISQSSWFPSKGSVYWKKVDAWSSAGLDYVPGSYVYYDTKIFLCTVAHTSSKDIVPRNQEYWKRVG